MSEDFRVWPLANTCARAFTFLILMFADWQIIKDAPDYLDQRLVQSYLTMMHGLQHCHLNFIIHRVRVGMYGRVRIALEQHAHARHQKIYVCICEHNQHPLPLLSPSKYLGTLCF